MCHGPFQNEKVLTNNKYIVRIGTIKTQHFHQIRSRKLTPQAAQSDILVRKRVDRMMMKCPVLTTINMLNCEIQTLVLTLLEILFQIIHKK